MCLYSLTWGMSQGPCCFPFFFTTIIYINGTKITMNNSIDRYIIDSRLIKCYSFSIIYTFGPSAFSNINLNPLLPNKKRFSIDWPMSTVIWPFLCLRANYALVFILIPNTINSINNSKNIFVDDWNLDPIKTEAAYIILKGH